MKAACILFSNVITPHNIVSCPTTESTAAKTWKVLYSLFFMPCCCDDFASTVGWGFMLHYPCGSDSYMARVCYLFFKVIWEASALTVYFRIIFVHMYYSTFQLQWLLWKWVWLSEKIFRGIIECDWNIVLNFALTLILLMWKVHLRTGQRERGSGGGSPLVRGSAQFANGAWYLYTKFKGKIWSCIRENMVYSRYLLTCPHRKEHPPNSKCVLQDIRFLCHVIMGIKYIWTEETK
jgi:hypothetical protein